VDLPWRVDGGGWRERERERERERRDGEGGTSLLLHGSSGRLRDDELP